MTQEQLECQIAGITGEPVTTILRLGFSILPDPGSDLEPEDLRLVLDCPFCGRPAPYPGPARVGPEVMAECERCDVYFGFEPEEVYPIGADRLTGISSE
jgi:hypothetical protein